MFSKNSRRGNISGFFSTSHPLFYSTDSPDIGAILDNFDKDNQYGEFRKEELSKKDKAPKSKTPNVDFYSEKIPMQPLNLHLSEFMKKFDKNYFELENTHSYIQWLFPMSEGPGVNFDAFYLTNTEAKIFRNTPELKMKMIASFRLMLDFYGMELVETQTVPNPLTSKTSINTTAINNNNNIIHTDTTTTTTTNTTTTTEVNSGNVGGNINGLSVEVKRKEDYQKHYHNIEMAQHNCLRISRILKSLKETGLEEYQKAFLLRLEQDCLSGRLRYCERSLKNFWRTTL